MRILGLICCLMMLSMGIFADDDVTAKFYVNGKMQHHAMIAAGGITTVEIEFTNPKTNEVFKDFKIMHGKIMHMIILKSDLSSFKHVHPYFDPITGRFFITLNMPLQDPDNFDTTDVLNTPGMYMIMADVVIKDLGMRMAHYHVMVKGEDQKVKPILDPLNNDGAIVKYFNRDQETDYYQATLNFEEIKGCGGNLVEFSLSLKKKAESGYTQIDTIEPWLGVGGHSVIVSENFMSGPMNTFDMAMGHMHSPGIDLEGNPLTSDFIFSLYDNQRLFPGINKIWIQVKDNGKVLKLPFTFNYQPTFVSEC